MARPASFTEQRISVVEPLSRNAGMVRTRYDKAFCVEWVSEDEVAVSTKCGHILRVHRQSGRVAEINLEGNRWVEPPIVTEEDLHNFRVDRGGIHCIRANASRNLLACSAGRPGSHNVYVLNLHSDQWTTVRRGIGHDDWAFTLSWVSDGSFVTGGRDKAVKLWSPHQSDSLEMSAAASYDNVHATKVRSSRL